MKINSEEIRRLRESKGLSLKDCAIRLNCSEATCSRYENGQVQRVSLTIMLGYSRLFNVPINSLYENAQTEWVIALEEAGLHDPRVAGFIEYLEEKAQRESTESLDLTKEEYHFITAYRNADKRTKRLVAYQLGISDTLQ